MGESDSDNPLKSLGEKIDAARKQLNLWSLYKINSLLRKLAGE